MQYLPEAAEYCDKETFEANCASNQVVIIKDAKYGRMRAGRCIDGKGEMHCHHDTTQLLHGICSGRQKCQIEVTDIGKKSAPCPKDYTSYLEADYKCEDCKYCNLIGFVLNPNCFNVHLFKLDPCIA